MPKVNPSWASELQDVTIPHRGGHHTLLFPRTSPSASRKVERASATVYLGIDPGASGGLAFLESSGLSSAGEGRTGVLKMPETDRDIWLWFDQYRGQGWMDYAPFAVIEQVGGFIGGGTEKGGGKANGHAMFKFGTSFGKLLMALTAAGIPFETVVPRTWQGGLKIPGKGKSESKGQFKARLKAKAQQLFPDVSVTLATCDALLLAEYVKRKREGKL
jgi:hypothetical protein